MPTLEYRQAALSRILPIDPNTLERISRNLKLSFQFWREHSIELFLERESVNDHTLYPWNTYPVKIHHKFVWPNRQTYIVRLPRYACSLAITFGAITLHWVGKSPESLVIRNTLLSVSFNLTGVEGKRLTAKTIFRTGILPSDGPGTL